MGRRDDINIGRASIDYTARDFEEIKKRLVDYVKINYPDSYKDFNASSFGSLMFDLVAYVGDTLSFYTDYVASESNLSTAQEQNQVEDLAAENGMPPMLGSIVQGIARLGLLLPSNADGTGLAEEYSSHLVIAAGNTVFTDQTGLTFMLTEDQVINLDNQDFINFESADIDGSTVKFYGVTIDVPVVCGRETTEVFEVGQPNMAQTLTLTFPNVSQVMSVISTEGNEWYQVPALVQNYIYEPQRNMEEPSVQAPSALVKKMVPRRFVLNKRRGKTFLEFGNASETDFSNNSVAQGKNVALQQDGKPYTSDTQIDYAKLTYSDSLGIAPANTSLAVTYKYNERTNVNVPARALNQVSSIDLFFGNESELNPSVIDYIKNNITITNEEPINGDVSIPNTDEIKHRAKGVFSAQNRAVTLEDYKSLVYTMSNTYGRIKRCNIVRDTNDYRRSLTIYIVAEGPNQKLQPPNSRLLRNTQEWINHYRSIADAVDVLPAKVINLGIEYDIVPAGNANINSLSGEIREMLFEELNKRIPDIGQHFNLSDIKRLILNFNGVSSIKSVRLVSKAGTGYEDSRYYDVEQNMDPSREYMYVHHDHIWEIKNQTDIVLKRDRPRRK